MWVEIVVSSVAAVFTVRTILRHLRWPTTSTRRKHHPTNGWIWVTTTTIATVSCSATVAAVAAVAAVDKTGREPSSTVPHGRYVSNVPKRAIRGLELTRDLGLPLTPLTPLTPLCCPPRRDAAEAAKNAPPVTCWPLPRTASFTSPLASSSFNTVASASSFPIPRLQYSGSPVL